MSNTCQWDTSRLCPFTDDIPQLKSERYIYADDIALLHCHTHVAAIEKTLSLDLKTLSQYFHNWRLSLNTTKTVCSIFHLANRLSKYELNVSVDSVKIPFDPSPTYLGVTLDRSLTYGKHLQKIAAKVTAGCNLLKTFATVNWGADFKHFKDICSVTLLFSC